MTITYATRQPSGEVKLGITHENASLTLPLKEYEAKSLRNQLDEALTPTQPRVIAILHGPTGNVEAEVAIEGGYEYRVAVSTPITYTAVSAPSASARFKQVRYVRDRPEYGRGVVGGPVYWHYRYAGEC